MTEWKLLGLTGTVPAQLGEVDVHVRNIQSQSCSLQPLSETGRNV